MKNFFLIYTKCTQYPNFFASPTQENGEELNTGLWEETYILLVSVGVRLNKGVFYI